jgi:hypothetical protein
MRKTFFSVSGTFTEKGRLGALFRYPLDLRDLRTVGEFPVGRNAAEISLDHRGIGDDNFKHFVGLGDGDNLPAKPAITTALIAIDRKRIAVMRDMNAPPHSWLRVSADAGRKWHNVLRVCDGDRN